jgi:D-alanyl-D-alanine carboxypeptidase/D-alanyl-D-alanine-endopeptidase (penicillin-binding protein 4)
MRRIRRTAAPAALASPLCAVLALARAGAGVGLGGTAQADSRTAGRTRASSAVYRTGAERVIAARLAARFRGAGLGPGGVGEVVDADGGGVLWSSGAAAGRMPASTAKLATAVAALTVLGPDHTEQTVTRCANGVLYLVGGGDPRLDRPALRALADDTATALRSRHLRRVTLRVDDSLFAAPALSPGWVPGYYPHNVAPVRALDLHGEQVQDTSLAAARVFAGDLAADGVGAGGPRRATAPAGAELIARHVSHPLAADVEEMLKVSDNGIAEGLLRLTALARNRPATWQGGTEAVRSVLRGYGVPLQGVALYDGSGLSRKDRMTAQALAAIAALAVDPRHRQRLWPLFAGLPVAGRDGTLSAADQRFTARSSRCAIGLIHAKTGTLHDATALAGVALGRDNRWRAFAFLENGATPVHRARRGLDALAATAQGCS